MATKIVQVGLFGDSVVGQFQVNAGPTNMDSREGWTYTVNNTGGGKFYCSSFGQNGLTIQNELNRVNLQLPVYSPFYDVFGIQVWSWNNSDLVASIATIQANVVSMVNAVQTAGKGWFVYILNPVGTSFSGTPAYVTAWQNLRTWMIATYPGKYVDTVNSVMDPANNLNWLAANSGDQIHPSTTGSPLIGASAMPQIKTILSNYGYSV
jgi:hypothetical protein